MQSITLQTSDSSVTSSDILGRLNFAASAESDGGAAILQVGSIYAMAEGTFSATANPASIVFATSASDTSDAQDRLKISHEGHVLPTTNNAYDLGSTSLRFKSTHTNALTINNAYSFPTSDGGSNQVLQTDGAGSLSFATVSAGASYTAGSGLTLSGTEFNVYGGSGNFEYLELQTDNTTIPKIKFTGSGVTDTPINLEVASSFESATGSGSALLFQGTQGQLFSITDNLSSGTIFSVSDITGLPMLEIDASGHVQIGEFADDITLHQAVLLSGGVPSSTTNKLYNNAGDLYWNGSTLTYDDAAISGYFESRVDAADAQTVAVSGYAEDYVDGNLLQATGVSGIDITNVGSTAYFSAGSLSGYFESRVDTNETNIALKANIASPTFTGTPAAPTATAGTNTTQLATTAFVSTAVANLVDSAPTTLDTLNELAAALGDDANFSTTVTNSLATKLANVVEDTTPQLGGTLDANGNTIDMGTYVITDAKVGQWDTAYGWGDHGSAGYLTAHPTISAASSSDNSGRTYIQDVILDSNGHVTGLATATETVTDTTYSAGTGITLSSTTFNANVDATTQTVAANTVSATSSRTYAVQVNASDELVVNVPWTDTDTNTQLSQEQVEDFAGNLIATGGTKTGITVTYQDSTNDVDFVVGGLTTTEIAASTLVTEAEGISSNDNDTTLPTSAAVKDYVDNNAGGGGGGTVQGTDGTYDIQPTSEGATTGNARGESSVDLQTQRSAATQVASGGCSVISGGKNNTASGGYSTVGGGLSNTASGGRSTVSGGCNNTASNYDATVGGGLSNTASGYGGPTVGGGVCNTASASWSTVSGGYCNTASGTTGSTVGGGKNNTASASYSSVAGGCCNITNARHSIIAGGHRNIIQSPTNECCSRGATIGGGVGHNSSGGTLNSTTGDLTGTITCCDAGRFSTIAGGMRNIATGACSTVGGGTCNTASSFYSTVGGGISNTASGNRSTVGGGSQNEASGAYSTIAGGVGTQFGNQIASGNYSSIGGGYQNTASGNGSTIGGGRDNTASGGCSTVSGGYLNTASGNCSTVGGGGLWNTASGTTSTVGGGARNTASATNSSVAGGCCNITNARHSIVAGGHRNIIQSPTNECCSRGATISGGVGHNSSGGTLSSTTGDLTGTITCCDAGAFSTIAGGLRNIGTGACSTVAGGQSNTASGGRSTVSGGYANVASGGFSTVSGGRGNTASGYASFVGGGGAGFVYGGNTASGTSSTIGGGLSNTASAYYSTVAGGKSNTASGSCSIVGGGGSNTASGANSIIGGGCSNTASAGCSIIVGGSSNTASCIHSVIVGGTLHTIQGCRSFVGGGCCNQILCTAVNAPNESVVVGGACNTIQCDGRDAFIGGGALNILETEFSVIGGGLCNRICKCGYNQNNTIGGGACNKLCNNWGSTIAGGNSNSASGAGQYGITIGGGALNSASANYVTVAGGAYNGASGACSSIGGGRSNQTSGGCSTIAGGRSNQTSGDWSAIGGGYLNTASASYSTVVGGARAKATRHGEVSHAAGQFAAGGDAQHTVLVARDSTTDATANQVLFLNGSSERLTIPAETTWMFTVKLAAHNDTDNDGGWWFFRGGIRRDAANNTSLIGTVFEEYSKDTNISSATASVVADDTNEALEIRVTGVASKNIRWVAVVDISQVSWGTP